MQAQPPVDWLFWATIANAAGAIVVAGFAVMQWKLTAKAEDDRKAERARDDEARIHTAYGVVLMEVQRMHDVVSKWKRRDLIRGEVLNLLEPSELLPQDWSSFATAAAQLGVEQSRLISHYLTDSRRVVSRVELFQKSVRDLYDSYGADYSVALKLDTLQSRPDLQAHVERVKALLNELHESVTDVVKAIHQVVPHQPPAAGTYRHRYEQRLRDRAAKLKPATDPRPTDGEPSPGTPTVS